MQAVTVTELSEEEFETRLTELDLVATNGYTFDNWRDSVKPGALDGAYCKGGKHGLTILAVFDGEDGSLLYEINITPQST